MKLVFNCELDELQVVSITGLTILVITKSNEYEVFYSEISIFKLLYSINIR